VICSTRIQGDFVDAHSLTLVRQRDKLGLTK
jgi:hypothetical protein